MPFFLHPAYVNGMQKHQTKGLSVRNFLAARNIRPFKICFYHREKLTTEKVFDKSFAVVELFFVNMFRKLFR